MKIALIASVGRNNELGRGADLVWHIKADLKFFKETTMGHPVIMGRKTFESLPKALPGRKNIVITRDGGFTAEGAEVVHSKAGALASAAETGADTAFIIGGAAIYGMFADDADEMYLTEIDAVCPEADVYFPAVDKTSFIKTVLSEHEDNGLKYTHTLYSKEKNR